MSVNAWMSWEAGVDLTAMTADDLQGPNLIINVARVVHTPVGSAPAGIILHQPDPIAPPAFAGFVCADPAVGAYFGPHIFAGTPFENAPVHDATISIDAGPEEASAHVAAGGFEFACRLTQLDESEFATRDPSDAAPFRQQVIEAAASDAAVTINAAPTEIYLPVQGITAGAAAAYTPTGIYHR